MSLKCRKVSVRSSSAQWNLDALVSTDRGDSIPCFFSVVPTWCTFQTVSSEEGENLVRAVSDSLGPPSSEPQVVKGGACDGGEEEEGNGFAFTGAMISVTWEFPKEDREAFIGKVKGLLGPCEGLAG